jgi:FAD:protein FMN transferase
MLPVPYRAIAYLSLFVIIASAPVLKTPLTRYEFSQTHMGTRFKIILYATDDETASRVSNAAFERIAQLDAAMSDYREDSELMSLCRQAGDGPVKVSEDLFRVLSIAQQWARRTNGAFDVTVGPLSQMWRRARRTRELPDVRRLTQARALTGYRKLHLDAAERAVRLDQAGMLLDLGGIAKGFAADEATLVLKQRGIRSSLVAAGGDVVVSDPPPDASGWVISVAPLETSERSTREHLLLRNAAVSTSGDAEQYVEIGGVRYSHIIDPRTGVGVTGRSSVTVIAQNGTTSDAVATALSVLGPERGLELIDSTQNERLAALFVQATDPGLRQFESKSWRMTPKKESVK